MNYFGIQRRKKIVTVVIELFLFPKFNLALVGSLFRKEIYNTLEWKRKIVTIRMLEIGSYVYLSREKIKTLNLGVFSYFPKH